MIGSLARRVSLGIRRRRIARRQRPQGAELMLYGVGANKLRELLSGMTIDGQNSGELRNYAREDCERFMRTLPLIPAGCVDVLEIGSSPYFLTVLAHWFRPKLKLSLTNYLPDGALSTMQEIGVTAPDGAHQTIQAESVHANIETDTLPFADASFDCVMFCEVLEHLTNDPVRALAEIRRVLRPGGYLVLTTPNVVRLENVARMMIGYNVYDPYSGQGAYGRHNREYTKDELRRLLQHVGFAPELMETHNVHEDRAELIYPDLPRLEALLKPNAGNLGQYHFTLSRLATEAKQGLPSWLYRSYPEDQLVD
jgi:SAM-dependent methyltransferase